jgi:thioredoxin reductase (NADPH)
VSSWPRTPISHYLVYRLLAHPSITVHPATQVTSLHGALRAVTLTSSTGAAAETACAGLFCFIGAQPATDWLRDVAVDEDGFIRTDRDLTSMTSA